MEEPRKDLDGLAVVPVNPLSMRLCGAAEPDIKAFIGKALRNAKRLMQRLP